MEQIAEEFDPLYPAGFHNISLDDIEEIFVLPFSPNDKRKYLMGRFFDFIERLLTIEMQFEIWIDGSYSTKKLEPNDMDILVVFDANEVNQLSMEKQYLINELLDRDLSKIRYSIDVLVLPSPNEDMRSYWRGWFGFSRKEVPKGIPKLSCPQ